MHVTPMNDFHYTVHSYEALNRFFHITLYLMLVKKASPAGIL